MRENPWEIPGGLWDHLPLAIKWNSTSGQLQIPGSDNLLHPEMGYNTTTIVKKEPERQLRDNWNKLVYLVMIWYSLIEEGESKSFVQ